MPILCEIYALNTETDVTADVIGKTIKLTELEIEPKSSNLDFAIQYSLNGQLCHTQYRCNHILWTDKSRCVLDWDNDGIFVNYSLKIIITSKTRELNGIATLYYELV